MTAGRFVWFDVLTNDPPRAEAFYAELFGWNFSDFQAGDRTYRVFSANGRTIGGVMPATRRESPSLWLPSLATKDLDASAALLAKEGGRIVSGPAAIPGVGRWAEAQDPFGAPLALFEDAMEGPMPPEAEDPAFSFVRCDLYVADPPSACRFYGKLAGWSWRKRNLGPLGAYHVARASGRDAAGIMLFPPQAPRRPFWMCHVAVPDADAATAKARERMGGVFVPPRDIPGMGRIAVLQDPTGAVLAVLDPSRA